MNSTDGYPVRQDIQFPAIPDIRPNQFLVHSHFAVRIKYKDKSHVEEHVLSDQKKKKKKLKLTGTISHCLAFEIKRSDNQCTKNTVVMIIDKLVNNFVSFS